ncbi:alpha/beta hydrolase [Candidatus Saccharibacteria bacterium]|nr:alpha/beta hydrolase [Candidatus Saccharibacteria bacterium]
MKLYIIHGWTYTVAPWAKTIEALKKYNINTEMLHVPGLTTDSRKVWTIAEYAKWADNNIPDGAIALGHSNGGRILLNLLSETPDKLKHLILLDSAGVYEKSTKRDVLRKVSKVAAPLKKVPGLRKAYHKVTRSTDYAKAPENMKKTLSNMLDSDKKLKIENVTTPTSILWGKADNVTPPRQAEVIYDKLPHSTLKFYDNWTHAPYISHPAELARAIAQALKAAQEAK